MNTTYRPLALLVLAGFCFSLLSWGIWIFVNEGADGFAAGVVSEVATSSIVIANRYQVHMTVLLSTSTTIRRGREIVPFDEIIVGSFVHIHGTTLSKTALAADSIQLMKGPVSKNARYED